MNAEGRRLAVRLVVYGAAAVVPCGILVGFLAREYKDAQRLEAVGRTRAAERAASSSSSSESS